MGDYNLDYLTPLEKENLDTVMYGFTVASPYLPTRVCKSTKTHIDYILAENIDDEKSFVFETPFKTDHFCFVLFTEVLYLLSSALEKLAPFKKVFLRKKTPKLFKETWFDEECKNLLRERQLAFEKYSKNSSSGNWSAYSKLRSNLSSVVKKNKKDFLGIVLSLSNRQKTAGTL